MIGGSRAIHHGIALLETPGWSALGMGCGAMGILGPLSRCVGDNGKGRGAVRATLNVTGVAIVDAARGLSPPRPFTRSLGPF